MPVTRYTCHASHGRPEISLVRRYNQSRKLNAQSSQVVSCFRIPLVQRKQIQCQNVHMYSRFSGPSGAYHARPSGQDGKIMPAAGNAMIGLCPSNDHMSCKKEYLGYKGVIWCDIQVNPRYNVTRYNVKIRYNVHFWFARPNPHLFLYKFSAVTYILDITSHSL